MKLDGKTIELRNLKNDSENKEESPLRFLKRRFRTKN